MNQNPKVPALIDSLVSKTLIGDYTWYRQSEQPTLEIEKTLRLTKNPPLKFNASLCFWFSNPKRFASLIADIDGRYFLLIKNPKGPTPALIRIDTIDYNRLRVVIENQLLNHPELNNTIDDFLNS